MVRLFANQIAHVDKLMLVALTSIIQIFICVLLSLLRKYAVLSVTLGSLEQRIENDFDVSFGVDFDLFYIASEIIVFSISLVSFDDTYYIYD